MYGTVLKMIDDLQVGDIVVERDGYELPIVKIERNDKTRQIKITMQSQMSGLVTAKLRRDRYKYVRVSE